MSVLNYFFIGLIDVYVYVRELGVIYKEDWLSVISAVLVGGIIMILVMFNINFLIVDEVVFILI